MAFDILRRGAKASAGQIKLRALTTGVAVAWLLGVGQAHAQSNYPNKPITLIVPYGPGSSTDILTRALAKNLAGELGQSVVVENRAGAGGSLGAAHVARSAPDGYTLVMGTISSHSINQSMMPNLPYSVEKDFAPVSLVAYFPNVVAVNKDLPVDNLQQLVAYTKQKGELSFGTGGIGSSSQMAAELLKMRTGVRLSHVPYKEVSQAISDTIAGHIPMLIYQAPALASQVNAGSLKALAVLAPERTPLLPNVPTANEQGIEDFDATAWMGLFAPRGTPKEVIDTLNRVTSTALKDDALQKSMAPMGFTLTSSTPEDFAQFVAKDVAKWKSVSQQVQ